MVKSSHLVGHELRLGSWRPVVDLLRPLLYFSCLGIVEDISNDEIAIRLEEGNLFS